MLYLILKTALLKSVLTLLYFYSVEHDSFLFFILSKSHCLFFPNSYLSQCGDIVCLIYLLYFSHCSTFYVVK